MYIFKASTTHYENNKAEIREAIREKGEASWKELGRDMISAERWPEFEKVVAEGGYWALDIVCTAAEVALLTDYGIRVDVSRVKGMSYPQDPRAILADASRAKSEVHIHVPGGVSLTSMRRVTWLEDACTQELQNRLDDGWRIIAVCPPNDCRRPTYILGTERLDM